ncbi:MAG: glycosyltransferase family 2 protein [Lachnospiraceae bacterium]|nr:glycosyltransferase family 2 protein [Lachnospiraceae bacterium]
MAFANPLFFLSWETGFHIIEKGIIAKMKEMVSIIVPTYNREKEIGRAIHSILQQTYEQYEIIVVDDGSTDNTREVVEKIEDKRIRYIQLEQNQGAGHARNVGVQAARYDYIAFLDSDDEWFPNKLELQMRKMLSSPDEVKLVYCRMGGCKRYSTERYIFPPEGVRKEILEGDIFEQLLFHNVIGTPTLLCHRECLERTGGFNEALLCLEDWELVLRMAKEWKVGFVDEVLVEVHKLEGSVSMNIGAYLVTRCYIVSQYREKMREIGILGKIEEEILDRAEPVDLYEEIKELLTRDIQL